MEASQTPGASPDPQDPVAPQDPAETGGPSAFPATAGASDETEVTAVESAADEVPSKEEANPAYEQAPVATDAQDAIIGDPGFRNEQQPTGTESTPTNVNQPVRTSAPPPSAQSGVPLPEDRAAGVRPGIKGPVLPVDPKGEGELPEHDGSEGQSTTPPMGG